MIATGTDIKPVEIVFFMRNVRSRNFFEQMKGRGVRKISPTEFNAVTPDAPGKDHFVIVDAVGVTETELGDTFTLNRNPSVPFDRVLDRIALGDRDPDLLSSLASRLSRLGSRLTPGDRVEHRGRRWRASTGAHRRPAERRRPRRRAAGGAGGDGGGRPAPIGSRRGREAAAGGRRAPVRREAGSAAAADRRPPLIRADHRHRERGQRDRGRVHRRAGDQLWCSRSGQFIEENRDEIAALQVLYERPYRQRLSFDDIKALAAALSAPPRSLTTDRLWEAYRRLDESRVRGSGQRTLADIVSVVRYAMGAADELAPFADGVRERFTAWLEAQRDSGRDFERRAATLAGGHTRPRRGQREHRE